MTTLSHYLMKYGEIHNYTTFFGMAFFRAFTLQRKTEQEETVSSLGEILEGYKKKKKKLQTLRTS